MRDFKQNFLLQSLRNLALLLIVLLSFETTAQTIHFIMVTQHQDAPGSDKDKIILNDAIDDIGRLTNMPVKKYIFDSQKPDLAIQILGVQADTDDVVWFYYSGYGQNAGDSQYPIFGGATKNFKLTKVHEAMKQKNARLAITTFDCSNIVGGFRTRQNYNMDLVDARTLSATAFSLLFKRTKGDIKMCSSAKSKYSFDTNDFGGFFTHSLLAAMREAEAKVGDLTVATNIWEHVLTNAKTKTNQLCRERNQEAQNPLFDINVTMQPAYVPCCHSPIDLNREDF